MVDQVDSSNPLVSVVMPSYNSFYSIERSVLSVLSQTYLNLELIIIDDGSEDETRSLLKRMASIDSRIKLVLNDINVGVAKARNQAIGMAVGDYIAFLDSDDIWLPFKLESQINIMISKGKYVSHTSYVRKDQDLNKSLGIVIAKKCVTYLDMLSDNYIGNLTGIYNCKVLGKIYQESVGHEDYLMWLDIIRKADSIGLEGVMAEYRVSNSSLSSNKFKAVLWHYNILRYRVEVSKLESFKFTLRYIYRAIRKRYF